MEWFFGLEGRNFSDLEVKKQHIIQRTVPTTEEGWCALAAVAMEVIGLREVVRLGDPRLWRQAVSELNTLPLPPLNLPLPLWDLYLAHPFDGVTLRMQDGQQVAVSNWSKLYYSWHSRWFALYEDKVVKFYDATEVAGGESTRPPAAQTTVLERLLWLQRTEKPVDFVVRTRQGRGFIVHGNNRFRLDQSGSLLILKQCEDEPVEILYLNDIVSVVLATTEPRVLIEQLQQKLKASPFCPFNVVLLHGGSYLIAKCEDVLITSETLYLGQRRAGSEVHEKILEIPIAWIDRFEGLPS